MTRDLFQLIDDAVQEAIFDPAPVGINVSGGLDSSTVCRFAHRWLNLPTFTGWYDEPGFSELDYARLAVARHPDTHHEIQITHQDFADNFDAMMQAFQPPYQGPGMFGQYMVAKHIAENTDVKVVLSGEGADELFGGYARLIHVADQPMPDGYENYLPPPDYPDNLEEALAYDLERLPLLLAVDDQALGAFGLEARAPFTNPAIVAYALGLPASERVGKQHLRRAVRGLVPDEIIDRTDKRGFPVPLVKWAQGPLREFISERIGYVPSEDRPFDRGWWNDLTASHQAILTP